MSGIFGPEAPGRYEPMDRGTEALDARMNGCQKVDVRQNLRNNLSKRVVCGCEPNYVLRYYANGRLVASSLEESECCSRTFCHPCYAWTTPIRDAESKAELLAVHRPSSCPLLPLKCCCYQSATISSGGRPMGRVRENWCCCVPSFSIYNGSHEHVYTLYPSTCCRGACVNCCAEGYPCTPGACCLVPFWIYPAGQFAIDGPAASSNRVGRIAKLANDVSVELFTNAHAFEVEFPSDATASKKAVLIGTSVYFNSLFFGAKLTDAVSLVDLGASLL
jgi:Scramblase